ncbi:MAG: hypothetical protein QW757_05085 [Candidatus Woesearchaeota archaeon]
MLIFRKNFSINYFLLFSIILIILMIFLRKIAIFLFFTIITAIFTYINYHIKFPFDLSPVLFLSLIISREYSFLFSIAFIIVTGIVPMVFAGGSFDHTTLFYLSIIFLVNFVNTKIRFLNPIIAFLVLILAHHIMAFFGSLSFGNNPKKEFINLFLKIFVDFNYVMLFCNIVIGLMK